MKIALSADHDCTEELRSMRLRATPARLGILQILERANTPLDVVTIMSLLQENGIDADEATVFRVLKAFTDTGLAKAIRFREDKKRYEYAGKPAHHHFVCERCGTVEDVMGCVVSEMEKKLEKTTGAKISTHSLEFFGTCRGCRA